MRTDATIHFPHLFLFGRDKNPGAWDKQRAMTFSVLFAVTSLLPFFAVGVVAMEGSPNAWQAWAVLGALLGGTFTAMILTIYRASADEYKPLSPVLIVALNMARALLAAPASLLSLTFVFAKYPEAKASLSEHWLLMSSAGAMAAVPFFIFMAVTILKLDRIKGKVGDAVANAAEKKLLRVLPDDKDGQ